MAVAARPFPRVEARATPRVHPAVWLAVAAGLLRYGGAVWDVSWHRTVGRDAFWTPPHALLYLGVALGLTAAAWAASEVAFADGWRRALRSPYLLPLLGGAVMVIAAPIDDAWHRAFGKDVDIWSPPHLIAVFGSAMSVLGWLRVVRNGGPRWLGWFLGGLLLYAGWFALNWYHMAAASRDALAYPALAAGLLFFLLAVAQDDRAPRGWRTAIALAFVVAAALPVVVLPPLGWRAPAAPPLLVVPALALDLLDRRLAHVPPLRRQLADGALFALLFVAVEWLRFALVPAPAAYGEDLVVVGPYLRWAQAHPWSPGQVALGLPLAVAAAGIASLAAAPTRRMLDGWFGTAER